MQSSKASPLGLLLIAPGLALGACSSSGGSEAKDEIGPICAACGPSSGGETGDFGGETVDCTLFQEEAQIADSEAAQLSLAELERRIALPFDLPFRWREYEDHDPDRHPLEASGYEPDTRVTATISPTGPFKFLRQQDCGSSALCNQCGSELSVEVRVELATADGAVQAVTAGRLEQAVGGDASISVSALRAWMNTYVDLRDVVGTLRFEVPRGGSAHGRLSFGGWLLPDQGLSGSLMIVLDIDRDDEAREDLPSIEGEFFFPLTGSFGS